METKEAIFGRRSIRKYKSTPIPEDVLREVIEAGLMAPSAINLQPWYFVVVQSPEKRQELVSVMGNVFGKFRPILEKRFATHPEVVEETGQFLSGLGGAPVCVLAFLLKPEYPEQEKEGVMQSVAAALENILLTAYDKGLGSCWLTAPLSMGFGPELQSRFAPDQGAFYAAVTLGYPDAEPKMPPRREGRYLIV